MNWFLALNLLVIVYSADVLSMKAANDDSDKTLCKVTLNATLTTAMTAGQYLYVYAFWSSSLAADDKGFWLEFLYTSDTAKTITLGAIKAVSTTSI